LATSYPLSPHPGIFIIQVKPKLVSDGLRTITWIKWHCKLYLEGKVPLDLVLKESKCLLVYFLTKTTNGAPPLFQSTEQNSADWKTGSNKIVGFKRKGTACNKQHLKQ
jgi:hypothetical protein